MKIIYYTICIVAAFIILFHISNSLSVASVVMFLGVLGFLIGNHFGIASGGWGDNGSWLFALIFMASGVLAYDRWEANISLLLHGFW